MRHRKSIAVILLLVLWGSRLLALEALPLHNDEGLHLTRAVEVWNLHPFWEIADGKIINHWPIALFYPQHAPVFTGRVATIFIAVIGLAAGYALARRLFGPLAALLVGVLWITTPYLFFFERLALSDAEAGALVVLTLWAALRLAKSGRPGDAILTGLALAAATLFKFTAAPYALTVALIVAAMGRASWRQRLWHLALIAGTVAACFAGPLLYLALRAGGFSIALGWIGGAGGADRAAVIGENMARLWAGLIGFGPPIWTVVLLVGLGALLFWRRDGRPTGLILLLAGLLPLLVMILLAAQIEPRHYVVGLPLALTLAGGGLGALISRIRARSWQRAAAGIVTATLLIGFLPFAVTAARTPGDLPLPPRVARQYITDHSAGFGLREAVQDFPQTVGPPGPPIIASMFPDSCRRANFYDTVGYGMICAAAPGLDAAREALAAADAVYVLAEAPPVGADSPLLESTGAQVSRIAAYPRPGETEETASVVLWRLERPE